MNRWEGTGGLVRDPEVLFLEGSGLCLWKATVAVNDPRYDVESKQQVVETAYVAISTIGWLAETIANLGLAKGDEVHVVGRLAQREVGSGEKKERKTGVDIVTLTPVRMRHRAPAEVPTPALPAPW